MENNDPVTTIPEATLQPSKNTSPNGKANSVDARIAFLVTILAETYRQKISKATIEAYRIGLRDLPIEAIDRAVQAAIRTSRFMPTPSELRELAGETSPADRAILAWAALGKAVVRIGPYRSPDFDDPIINATVRSLGGWERVCSLGVEEFDKWLQKDFLRTYEAFARTGVGDEQGAPLIGIAERHNRAIGYDRPQDHAEVRTGLPWAGETRKFVEKRATNIPRVEFRRVNQDVNES